MRNRPLFCFACILLSVIALSLLLSSSLVAQEKTIMENTEGTEFWIAFQRNFRDSIEAAGTNKLKPSEPLHQGLTISGTQSATGYVEVSGTGFRQDFTIEPNKPVRVWLDAGVQVISSEVVENLGVHVVSSNPVTVTATSHRYQTTDSYLALPVATLGRRYRAMGYKWLANDLLSQFAVVAAHDQTTVTIVPSVHTKLGRKAGKPFTITLNRGEVYQVMPEFNPKTMSDLTGSLVEADKPVALFSGNNCAYVPTNMYKACNILIEQLPPTDTWGTSFVASPFADRKFYILRVVADKEGTEVTLNGKPVATLGPGGFYEAKDLKDHAVISSNLPVMVTQFATGFTYRADRGELADSIGDPMMILLPPTNGFLATYHITVPFDGEWENYVNLTVPAHAREALRVNGKPVDPSIFHPLPNSSYVAGSLRLEGGTHRIDAPEPFGLIQYGFGYGSKIYDAYGNVGGMGLPRSQAPVIVDELRIDELRSKVEEEESGVEEMKKRETSRRVDRTGIER